MEVLTYVIPAGLTLVTAGTSYLIHKTIDLDKQMAAHVAADAQMFNHFEAGLKDLKEGQRDQTQKLDRLIENMLEQRRK